MKRTLTREEMHSHIKSMAKKNCVYAVIYKHLTSTKKENQEKFWQKIEEQKFDNIINLDVYLESQL